jgi:hypothetical protein
MIIAQGCHRKSAEHENSVCENQTLPVGMNDNTEPARQAPMEQESNLSAA